MIWVRIRKSVLLISVVVAVALSLLMQSLLDEFFATKVIFLDVGQGDAILISQGSNQILIDGGRSGKILLSRLGEYMPFWDRMIEIVIETHPDEDHIGGLVDVIKKYDIGVVVDTKKQSDSEVFHFLQEQKKQFGINDVEAMKGMVVTFPQGDVLEIMYPNKSFASDETKDTNASSIVAKLSVSSGKTFLFTGDLPSEEESLIDTGYIDVLKAGHHGSKYSSSEEFLDKIQPREVVLSVGSDNRYGHPNQETMDRFLKRDMRIFRTDKQGSIMYTCQGSSKECLVSVLKN